MNPFVLRFEVIAACPVKGGDITQQSAKMRGTDRCRSKKTGRKGNF